MSETVKAALDSKGRPLVSTMSDSEKLDEVVHTMRNVYDALDKLGQNPMLKSMIPGGIGL